MKIRTLIISLGCLIASNLLSPEAWTQEEENDGQKKETAQALKRRAKRIKNNRIRPSEKVTANKNSLREGAKLNPRVKQIIKANDNTGEPPASTDTPKGSGTTGRAAATPLAAPATGAGSTGSLLPGEKEFNDCIRIPARRRIKVTLKQESELSDLVGWISSMTCKQFIVPTTLKGQKVTLISPTPVTAGEAYHAFLSALEVMGLTVVPAGKYLKVVQSNWAIQSQIDTYGDRDRDKVPNSDEMITQLVRVENVDANELAQVLGKMKSRNGDITIYKPTNMMIITDVGYNVRRMLTMVKELDQGVEGEKIWVVKMKNADAEEVVKIITQLIGQNAKTINKPIPRGTAAAASPMATGGEEDVSNLSASKIIADPLSNSIIIVAGASSFSRISSLIKKLDVESEGISQKIHVYYLENASAEEMANGLSNLAQAGGAKPGGGQKSHGAKAGGTMSGTLFEGEVKVSADKPTNSLLIMASNKDYLNLRAVIKRLDIPRRQVFVEATIMEINLDKTRELGLAYHMGKQVGSGDTQTTLFGAMGTQSFNSLAVNPLMMMGLAAGALGPKIEGSGSALGLGADIPAFGVMFMAMQSNSNVNVLSPPHILTTDNEPAEITVGQNVPMQGAISAAGLATAAASSSASGLGSMLAMQSIQRQDVALRLKITPHVNDSDMVRLEIDQEVSDIAGKDPTLGPTTSKRTAKTTVVVRDQQTVVIGGMMKNSLTDSETKIPILGDIPILGYLFKNTQKKATKLNLLIVLTPYVIRDQADLRRIYKRKIEERREFIERYSNFEAKDPPQNLDYRHKRGLLGEISVVGEQAEIEGKMLEDARKKTNEKVEPFEMPQGMNSRSQDSSSTSSSPGNISSTSETITETNTAPSREEGPSAMPGSPPGATPASDRGRPPRPNNP